MKIPTDTVKTTTTTTHTYKREKKAVQNVVGGEYTTLYLSV